MGASNELQYGLPIALIAVLLVFIIKNYKLTFLKKYAFIGSIIYTFIKILLLKLFNFNIHIINLCLFTLILINIYFIIEFYFIKHKEKNKKELYYEVKVGFVYGLLLILFPIIIMVFHIDIYNSELKNLILITIECFLSGFIYLTMSRIGLKKIKNEDT